MITFRLSEMVKLEQRQKDAFRMIRAKKFTLYGGARGGGKSYFLRWLALILLSDWASKGFRGVRVAIFCETFPTLKDRQMARAQRGRPEEIYPLWLGVWNNEDHEFRIHAKYGGGVVCFRNLDDPGKYLSSEFAAILVDELTRSGADIIMKLLGSLRWPGIEHTPFVASTNPGSKGHAWVKDVFIDSTFELEETKNLLTSFGKDAFGFVQAKAGDNSHNADSYLAMLRGLPDRLRSAYLEGNWDSFDGQAFTQWRREIHVVPNGIAHLSDAIWIAGLDWGYRKAAYVLAAVLPERIEVVLDVPFSKLHTKPAGMALMRLTRHLPRPSVILYDDQMDQQPFAHERLINGFRAGITEELGELAPTLIAASKGPGSRNMKYQLLHELLQWGPMDDDGTLAPWRAPQLVFQKRARYLGRSIPALQVDPDRPDEDIDTDGDDHGYDALMNICLHVGLRDRHQSSRTFNADAHPGMDATRKRRRRTKTIPPLESERGPLARMPRADSEYLDMADR